MESLTSWLLCVRAWAGGPTGLAICHLWELDLELLINVVCVSDVLKGGGHVYQ